MSFAYGSRTAFSSASNLNSLGIGAACAIGAVDNSSTLASAFLVDFAVTLGATGVSSTGTIVWYLIQSDVSTSSGFTDGISPTGTSVASSIKNAIVARVSNANATSQVVAETFCLPVPNPSTYWSLVALNNSGAAFAASGNSADYTPITY